jgi:hypothetical protein
MLKLKSDFLSHGLGHGMGKQLSFINAPWKTLFT